MTAASRQSGMEGTDGSVGLKVMPIDSMTLSDGYDARERAPTRLIETCGVADLAGMVVSRAVALKGRGGLAPDPPAGHAGGLA